MDLNNLTNRYILGLIEKTNNPTLNTILSILDKKGQVPNFQIKNLPYGVSGSTSDDGSRITIDQTNGGNVNTFAHEMTHALDTNMGNAMVQINRNKMNGLGVTPEQQQFSDAYLKLMGKPSPAYPGINDLSPYRRSTDEAAAFGVGNMAMHDPAYSGASHMDASYAQEQDILRSMYDKLNTNPPVQSPGFLQQLMDRLGIQK